MFVIIWEFEPHPARLPDFEEAYGPAGEWARLFNQSKQYLGTELLRDASRGNRYLTVDRWASREGFDTFCSEFLSEYEALDRACDALTRREVLIGRFHFP